MTEHTAGQDGQPAGKSAWQPSGRLIFAMVLIAIILIFAVANTEKAKIDFVFGHVTLPVVFIIAIPAFLGFGAGSWLPPPGEAAPPTRPPLGSGPDEPRPGDAPLRDGPASSRRSIPGGPS